jgi:hypothetical protein
MEQVVAVLPLIVVHAAGPEMCHFADNRPAVFLQPRPIVRGEVVLPLRRGDIAIDVNFALAKDSGEVRCLFAAILRIGFPGKHRASIAALPRPFLRRVQRAPTKIHQ